MSFEERKINILQMKESMIQDVWSDNFLEQLNVISELIESYPVIAMIIKDTEFPGVDLKNDPSGDEKEYEYLQIKRNVKDQQRKIIQIGLSIANESGETPQPCNTWQFNFQFDEDLDKIQGNAKRMLKDAGINFEQLKNRGIPQSLFGDYFTASDMPLNEEVKWIVFHGGFDFGYLVEMLHHAGLPDKSEEFMRLLGLYFPTVIDLKYSIKDCSPLKDVGLSRLADKLQLKRIGPEHQAGSDALLTLACYFKLKPSKNDVKTEIKFENINQTKNIVYGIHEGYIKSKYQDLQSQQQDIYEYDQQFNIMYPNFTFQQSSDPSYYYFNDQQSQQQYQYLQMQQQQYFGPMYYQQVADQDPAPLHTQYNQKRK